MRRSNWRFCSLILLGFVLFHSACAQNPPFTGNAYVKEENLVAGSTVLLNNGQYLVPLQNLDQLKIASIHFTNQNAAAFDSLLNKYAKVQAFKGLDYRGLKTMLDLVDDLKWYNTVIIQLNYYDLSDPQILGFVTSIQKIKNVVVALFGNGNAFQKLDGVTAPIIWSERESIVADMFSAQAIFGGVAITEKLQKTYTPNYRNGMGFTTTRIRLQYTVPEDAGVNSANLKAIDNIAYEAIAEHATPGCVVLVVKDGKVIFNKAYGYHTYDKAMPDKLTDIFDLASMTKISATTMEAMQLVDDGKLDLDGTIADYIPAARNTNKNDLRIREVLTHQAGLIPDIPTFEKIKPIDHSQDSSAAYPTRVADNYYVRKNYFKDVMFPDMLNSPVRTRGEYVYSDVSLLFMKEIEENITSIPLNTYVSDHFYKPLGMQTAGFLPLNRFGRSQIIPTENDIEYRHTQLLGDVHDPTAALMGGVAGHAGLFGSANDVAILYQMMLNRGTYGGVQYINPGTVDLFTAQQTGASRRGLGFDRWDPIADRHYPSRSASPQTFGHTGFTGTCVWVDPKYNLVYVFLSNRVNPTVSSKLGSLNIRPRIQDAIYEAIGKGL